MWLSKEREKEKKKNNFTNIVFRASEFSEFCYDSNVVSRISFNFQAPNFPF